MDKLSKTAKEFEATDSYSETSSPMGNDGSAWSWRHHNLQCSKAGNSELITESIFCTVLVMYYAQLNIEINWLYYLGALEWTDWGD